MKILVTGDRGFVGKETVKLLIAEGHEVVGCDIMDGRDIRDYAKLREYIKQENPARILHLAATARFTDADRYPEKCFSTNYIGTLNIAQISAELHIPVVYASTGTVYMPINKEMPITENFPAYGNSNYGCSKRLGEEVIMKYAGPWIILRYGHLYGAEKKYHGLIGGILAKIRMGQKPQVWGGEQTNDFAYVKDIALANLKALTATWENWHEIYNIGTGVEIATADAAKTVCRLLGYEGEIEITSKRDVDPLRFVYDVSKAKSMINFQAQFSFEDGLKDMLAEISAEIKEEK